MNRITTTIAAKATFLFASVVILAFGVVAVINVFAPAYGMKGEQPALTEKETLLYAIGAFMVGVPIFLKSVSKMNLPNLKQSILIGKSTLSWLTQKGLLPESWTIPKSEYMRMDGNIFGITIVFSPASNLELASEIKTKNLIICDATLLEEGVLTEREFTAQILHEIGHVLNVPDGTASYVNDLKEFYADDYARLCGYENELLSSLQKLTTHYPNTFGKPLTGERIKRIQDATPAKANQSTQSSLHLKIE